MLNYLKLVTMMLKTLQPVRPYTGNVRIEDMMMASAFPTEVKKAGVDGGSSISPYHHNKIFVKFNHVW